MPQPFSLLTWNVLANVHVTNLGWYPNVLPEHLSAAFRRPRIIDQLARLDPDVFCLQEVDDPMAAAIMATFPDRQFGRICYGGEGQLVGVRRGAAAFDEIPMGKKGALLTALDAETRILSVHLTWTGEPPATPRRGCEQLRHALAWDPTIVCGDFNSFPDWPERRALSEAGFLDRSPPGPTCNVKRWLQPLDAVYTTPSWHGVVRSLPPILADTPMPSPNFPSDHLPIFVRFG